MLQVSRSILLGTLLILTAGIGAGQVTLGSIAGRVTDPQGAMIPSAAVTITHTDTNAVSRTLTNETGYFEVSNLRPGLYTATAESTGFKTLTRKGLTLNVGGRVELALVLEVGQVTETVDVTASAPLLDTTTASGGRIISRQQILDLPFPDMNPFMMSMFAPGMIFTGALQDTKPWDNGAISSFNSMGGVGRNEYTIDGAPVTGTDGRVGYAPPSDAVEEFKVEGISFDATVGHTTGASINVMTRAGTNTYHGAIFDQHYQQRWNATPHFTRLNYEDAVRRGLRSPSEQKQGSGRLNDVGAALGGPVRIPKLYNGRDKLFFFFNYTGIWLRNAAGSTGNVPETAWRTGDFSELLRVDPALYTIYDPRTARLQNGRVVRTPFPGNRGIPVLNPVYNAIEPIYPTANRLGPTVTADGLNNYTSFSSNNNGETYWALLNRVDYNISERHRVFGRWFWNNRDALGTDWSRDTVPGLNRFTLARVDKGLGLDYFWSIGAATSLNIGANWNRFGEGNNGHGQTDYSPTDIGLPAYLDAKAGDLHQMPRITFSSLPSVSNPFPRLTSLGGTGEVKVGMTHISGNHSFKWGWHERRYVFSGNNPGYTSGAFTFNNTYVRAADNTNTAAVHALEWASFMMGLPTSATIDSNDSSVWSAAYRAFYFQDDLRVTRKLRLSLALRYEREQGIGERFDRGIAGGFLYDAKLPITDAAQAAYAANPLPELSASQFRVVGGTQYLGSAPSNRYSDGTHRLMPRFSGVYAFNQKSVLRVGYGWFYDTLNPNNFRPSQDGFSQPTSTILSPDLGLTFCCGVGQVGGLAVGRTPMNDPFPVRADGTRFDSPYRDRIGLMALAGRGATVLPRDYAPAFQQRWRVSFQRELLRDMVLDVSYNGSYARIPVNQRVDFLPVQYWATGSTRDQAVEDDMNRNVPNPFHISNFSALQTSSPELYNYMSRTAFFTQTTVRKNVLLRQFPQTGGLSGLRPGVDFEDSRGANRYHDFQVQIEKRFAQGLQTSLMYTRSKSESSDFYNNEFDGAPSWRINNASRPNRLIWTAIYELPFGAGKPLARSGVAKHIFGDWQLGAVYQYQTGPATTWGNLFYYGDRDNISSALRHDAVNEQDIHLWFDPAVAFKGTGAIPGGFTGFEGRTALQPGQFHARVFPNVLEALRGAPIRKWDIRAQRKFAVTERVRVKVIADALNVTNHTIFNSPNTDPTNTNFGRVTSVNGRPRLLQFTLRIEF